MARDQLKALLDEGKDRVRAFYLAVAPAIFGDISEKIRDHKLITKMTRIVVEKPIGRDLASALELNDTIGKVFQGRARFFRIDHYLGKETVQNLMALRFANTLYEPPVELILYRSYPDHRCRIGSGWKAVPVTMTRPAALTRHGAEPYPPAALPRSPWKCRRR